MARLTRRQREIYAFLRDNAATLTRPPTLDELCRMLGLRSRGSLHKHIQALVEAGLVEPMAGRQRGVCLTMPAASEDVIPFVGRIAAGRPIEAVAQEEWITVPARLRTGRPCYVLEVRGESMSGAGILDGDLVVVEQRDHARDGEIVVALIRGEEATLKRIEQRPDQVILHPDNLTQDSMAFDPGEVSIQGVVVGQMRSYR